MLSETKAAVMRLIHNPSMVIQLGRQRKNKKNDAQLFLNQLLRKTRTRNRDLLEIVQSCLEDVIWDFVESYLERALHLISFLQKYSAMLNFI